MPPEEPCSLCMTSIETAPWTRAGSCNLDSSIAKETFWTKKVSLDWVDPGLMAAVSIASSRSAGRERSHFEGRGHFGKVVISHG
jgi:hypothetical protein